jgi:hypothetical protein
MKEKDIWITKFKPCIYSDKLLGRIIAINAKEEKILINKVWAAKNALSHLR